MSQQQNWISVKDYMPEPWIYVKMKNDKGIEHIGYYRAFNKDFVISDGQTSQITFPKVVAWQPLPQPPTDQQ